MSAGVPSGPGRYLVVVRRDRPALYERLSTLAAPGVDVRVDRRLGDRRTSARSIEKNLRRGERRRSASASWATLGVTIQRAVPRFD